MTAAPRLFTVAEAAKHLGVGTDTVREFVAAGELRVVNVRGRTTTADRSRQRNRLRIREDDLAAFIDARTTDLTA